MESNAVRVEPLVSEVPVRAPSARQPAWRRYVNSLIAAEISALSRYYDRMVQIEPREHDSGLLLEMIDCPEKEVVADLRGRDDLSMQRQSRRLFLVNGNLNHDLDIEQTLARLRTVMGRGDRVVLVAYNPYMHFLYGWANRLGIRKGEKPTTFLTRTGLASIAALAGLEVTSMRNAAYCPWRLGGVGSVVNALLPLVPLARWCSLASVIVLRPQQPEATRPSLSIIIPARNEKGNIENALKRLDYFRDVDLEIIFVEGHSSDGTWEEIQRVIPLYQKRYRIKALQQSGKGKSDAVRLGFSQACNELVTILDADLTMPPELLHRFYDAYCRGLGDFVNGNRLTYPMEGEAMRFLNRLGNVFFAKALSAVLGVRLGDSLCGTKLLRRADYARFVRWRGDFGDFDPFGDFELLFPAAILALGIIDMPIRYRQRVYGSTNISRFRHGWMLLKMTLVGFLRVKPGRVAASRGVVARPEMEEETVCPRGGRGEAVHDHRLSGQAGSGPDPR